MRYPPSRQHSTGALANVCSPLLRHKNLAAHCSPAFRVEVGDNVTVGQCRPLSKTVRCVQLRSLRRVPQLTLRVMQLQRAARVEGEGEGVHQVLSGFEWTERGGGERGGRGGVYAKALCNHAACLNSVLLLVLEGRSFDPNG